MLSKNTRIQREQLEMVAIDQLVPQDHLVRKMEAALDFSFIYDLVEDVYGQLDMERSSNELETGNENLLV